MRWMAPLAFAVVLFALTLRTAFIEPLIVIGVAALALVVVGLLLPWRWPFVAAACLFLTGHALALWGMDAPVDVPGGLGFGLALLFLLHSAHAGRAMRGASVGARVLREQIVGWVRFAVVALLRHAGHGPRRAAQRGPARSPRSPPGRRERTGRGHRGDPGGEARRALR